MSYNQASIIPAEALIKLSEFLQFYYPNDREVFIGCFEEAYKCSIDFYFLIFYTEDGSFHVDTEEVYASLLIWNHDRFEDTSDLEKELFVKEHGFYKFKWFYPD